MRCRFCYGLAKFHISYLNATLKVKASYGVDLWGDIDCSTDISILLPAVFGIIGIWWSLAATQDYDNFCCIKL